MPLQDTAVKVQARYLVHSQKTRSGGDHIIFSNDGQQLVYWKVHGVFRTLLKSAGVKPGGRWPRIYEPRHTFAVPALESSPTGPQRTGHPILSPSPSPRHPTIHPPSSPSNTTHNLLP